MKTQNHMIYNSTLTRTKSCEQRVVCRKKNSFIQGICQQLNIQIKSTKRLTQNKFYQKFYQSLNITQTLRLARKNNHAWIYCT